MPEPARQDLHEPAPDLRGAVATSLEAMDWLVDSDQGLRAVALRLAQEIETAQDRADEHAALMAEARGDRGLHERLQALEARCEVTKVVGWLGPQLQGVLRDLGGTPVARAAMKANAPVGGRLAELRRGAAARQHDP